jgi:GNAT superfamily N-acetyltransferase
LEKQKLNYFFQQLAADIYEIEHDDLIFSSDKNKLDITYLHKQLSNFYWAKNISLDRLKKSLEYSVCYGIYKHNQQLGFARVVTDFSQEAILCDVFIDDKHQGKGLGKILVQMTLESPITKDCFRWVLLTKDAHSFYEQFGFVKSELAMFRLTETNY